MQIAHLLPAWPARLASALALAAAAAGATPADGLERLLAERGLLQPTAVRTQDDEARLHASDRASGVVVAAMNFLGVPYQRGGDNEQGFDCSGFTRHLFETSLGLLLPRRAEEQAHSSELVPVARQQLQPGDLVFFNTLRRTFSHVGIYVGDGRFIHAPRPGAHVRLESMRVPYWRSRFTGARRPAGLVSAREQAPARAPEPPSTLGFPPMY